MDELQSSDPRRIGPYWLEGRLGSGGMGRVYLGRSPGGRRVAIKVIRSRTCLAAVRLDYPHRTVMRRLQTGITKAWLVHNRA